MDHQLSSYTAEMQPNKPKAFRRLPPQILLKVAATTPQLA